VRGETACRAGVRLKKTDAGVVVAATPASVDAAIESRF